VLALVLLRGAPASFLVVAVVISPIFGSATNRNECPSLEGLAEVFARGGLTMGA
jgi:hypothetical protein